MNSENDNTLLFYRSQGQKKSTWTVPLQYTQTASGQSLWTPETENIILWSKFHKLKKRSCKGMCALFFLPDLSPGGSSWLWAARVGRAGPVLVSAGPQRCWLCTASKLWSPAAQTNECGCGWHSGETKMRPQLSEQQHLTQANEHWKSYVEDQDTRCLA